MGCLRNWVYMLLGMGLRSVVIVGPVKFECVSYNSQGQFFELLKTSASSGCVWGFMHRIVFNKMIFCLGEKQGMIINNDCSMCYNRVSVFFCVGLGEKKGNFVSLNAKLLELIIQTGRTVWEVTIWWEQRSIPLRVLCACAYTKSFYNEEVTKSVTYSSKRAIKWKFISHKYSCQRHLTQLSAVH